MQPRVIYLVFTRNLDWRTPSTDEARRLYLAGSGDCSVYREGDETPLTYEEIDELAEQELREQYGDGYGQRP